MLVEFTRCTTREDEDGFEHPMPISINPNLIGAIFEHAEHRGETIIRLGDGRGFSVRDPYNIVVEKIKDAMGDSPRKAKTVGKSKALPAPTEPAPETVSGQAEDALNH